MLVEIEGFQEDFRLAEEPTSFPAKLSVLSRHQPGDFSRECNPAMRHFAYLEDNNGTGIISGTDLSANFIRMSLWRGKGT